MSEIDLIVKNDKSKNTQQKLASSCCYQLAPKPCLNTKMYRSKFNPLGVVVNHQYSTCFREFVVKLPIKSIKILIIDAEG